jgi:molybdopterin synthase sulfur carrier subunit
MQVKVKMFATFRIGRFKEKALDFPQGTTVAKVIQELAISSCESGVVVVNGSVANLERVLVDDDVLSVFPLVAGG